MGDAEAAAVEGADVVDVGVCAVEVSGGWSAAREVRGLAAVEGCGWIGSAKLLFCWWGAILWRACVDG